MGVVVFSHRCVVEGCWGLCGGYGFAQHGFEGVCDVASFLKDLRQVKQKAQRRLRWFDRPRSMR